MLEPVTQASAWSACASAPYSSEARWWSRRSRAAALESASASHSKAATTPNLQRGAGEENHRKGDGGNRELAHRPDDQRAPALFAKLSEIGSQADAGEGEQ